MKRINHQIVAQIHARQFKQEVQILKDGNLQYFKDLEDLLKKYDVKPKILGSFKVGEVFNKHKFFPMQNHSADFSTLLSVSDANVSVSINAAKLKPLNEYHLERSLVIDDLQKLTGRKKVMDYKTFWLTLYALTIDKDLGIDHLKYEIETDHKYVFYISLYSGRRLFATIKETGTGPYVMCSFDVQELAYIDAQVKTTYLY